jgi:hypothetical protein
MAQCWARAFNGDILTRRTGTERSDLGLTRMKGILKISKNASFNEQIEIFLFGIYKLEICSIDISWYLLRLLFLLY